MSFPPLALLALKSAFALTPPVGWTKVDAHRAVLDPIHPENGELREFLVAGGSGDPDELVLMLQASGIKPSNHQVDALGAVNLAFPERLGRARSQATSNGVAWVLVMVHPDAAGNIDPDAVLKAALPPAGSVSGEGMVWGQAEPLPGGTDGQPWGASAPADGGDEGWGQNVEVEAWTHDQLCFGKWEGSALIAGVPTRLNFRFEGTGNVVLETKARGATEVHEGQWGTRSGRMRLVVPGGGEDLEYRAYGETLSLEYRSALVTLHKKKK